MLKTIKSKLSGDANLKELVTGSFVTFVLKMSGMLLSYLAFYFIAKKNGSEGVGYYSLISQLVMLIGLISVIGTDVSIIRFVGQFNNKEGNSKLRSIYLKNILLIVPISLLLGLGLYFFSGQIATSIFHEPEYAEAIEIIAIALPLYGLNAISIEFIRGLKKLKISEFIRSVSRPLIILGALAVYWTQSIPNIYFIYFLCITIAVNAFISSAVVFIHLSKIKKSADEKDQMKISEIVSVSFPMMVTTVVSFLLGSMSIFFLEHYSSTENVGIYSAALRIAQLTTIILTVVNTISAPKFSELFWADKKEELQRLLHQSVKLMFWVSLALGVAISAGSYWILKIFGEEFVTGQLALIILIVGNLFNAATGSVGLFLNMSGNQHILRNTSLMALSLQIILSLILIPPFGILGAAIMTTSTIVLWNIVNLIYVQKKLGYRTYYLPFAH